MKKAQGLPYNEDVLNDDSNISRLYGQKTYNVKERLIWRATDQLTLTGRGGYFFRTSERDTYNYHFNAYSAGLKGRYSWDQGRHLELSYAYDQYDKAPVPMTMTTATGNMWGMRSTTMRLARTP